MRHPIPLAVSTCHACELFRKLIPARNKEHHDRYRRNQNLPGNEISLDVRYVLHFVTATLVGIRSGISP